MVEAALGPPFAVLTVYVSVPPAVTGSASRASEMEQIADADTVVVCVALLFANVRIRGGRGHTVAL